MKIPAAKQGLPAISACLAEGISINVTLIFSLARYGEVIEAFLAGLESARAAGRDLSGIASVASFFVSRVDTETDKRLDKIGTPQAAALRGKAAIANARLAYQRYEEMLATDRWKELERAGARPQRPLWASTSVKDPAYEDTRYVTGLVAPDVVNTMPEATLNAVADHGDIPDDSIHGTYADSQAVLDDLAALGIDYDDVVQTLEDQGVTAFDASWDHLGQRLATALGTQTGVTRCQPQTRSSSPAAAWPAPRPRKRCASRASTAGSCWPPRRTSGPTSGRRCPRTTCRARPSATQSSCTPLTGTTPTRVELLLGTAVTGIDRGRREVTLSGGGHLGYGRLLLATGSVPRRLPLPGADADGVLYLRRVEDSDRIRDTFTTASRVLIIGAGWIGLEVAAAARRAGVEVTILEAAELPLLHVLGPQVAPVFADLHREHGVDLRLGVRVAEITVSGGKATGARLADGTRIGADAVIVGIGAAPQTRLAEAAGLDVRDGVVTDASLRTSDPAIYAAGDIASAFHPLLGRHIRVEHWANALHQPETAAGGHARPGCRLRPGAVLLHRPVRPGHGIRRLRRARAATTR